MGALAIFGSFFNQTQPYYSRHPVEPPPAVAPFFEVTDFSQADTPHLSLEQVLDAILGSSSRDILIVSHGSENGINLSVGAAPLLLEVVSEINNEVCGRAPQTLTYSPGGRRSTSISISRTLLDKVRRVQALQLNKVYIRACKVGNDSALLDTFASLLNCQSINAPRLKSVFTSVWPGRLSGTEFEHWAFSRRSHRQVEGLAGSRIAYELIVNANHTVNFNLRVEGADDATASATLRTWLSTHFFFRDTSFVNFGRASLVIECLYSEATRQLYFPKDSGYATNLNTVSRSRSSWCAPISIDDSLALPF